MRSGIAREKVKQKYSKHSMFTTEFKAVELGFGSGEREWKIHRLQKVLYIPCNLPKRI